MKPALRRIVRDGHTLQYGVHPGRLLVITKITPKELRWLNGLDGTWDLAQVLREAARAGLDEETARGILDELMTRGVLHDAAVPPDALKGLSLAQRDRLGPDLAAADLASVDGGGGLAVLARRRAAKVRVYGAGRIGAQVVAILAAAGVGDVRVFDTGAVRPRDLTPGGLGWDDLGLSRQDGAVAAALRLIDPRLFSEPRQDGAPVAGPPRGTAPGPRPPAPPAPGGSPAEAPDRRRGDGQRTPQGQAYGVQARQPQLRDGSDSSPEEPPTRRPSGGAVARRPGTVSVPGQQATRTPGESRGRVPGGSGDQALDRGQIPGGARVPGGEEPSPPVNVRAGGPYLGDGSHRPDLVILAPVEPLDGVLVNELAELGIPHILVSAFEGYGSVGPLVLPGVTACLHCMDLARGDKDSGWPLATARLGGYPPGEVACDTALATTVAGNVAGHALAFLDGKEPVVTNTTIDVMPDWQWKHHTWEKHPQCRCMRNDFNSLRMVKADTCASPGSGDENEGGKRHLD